VLALTTRRAGRSSVDAVTTWTYRSLTAVVERMFAPARHPGRLGAEVELIPVTNGPRPRPVEPATLAAGFDPAFVADAVPTFEPGGQLELSPPPQPSAAALLQNLNLLWARADRIAARCGVRLEAAGTNPYHCTTEIPLRTPSPRYLAMQDAFDRVGPHGRQMMRLTASLQIAVDLVAGAGLEQWLVANLAGPPLSAAFANSPCVAGCPAGTPAARTRIWRGIDPTRTGYDGRHLDLTHPIRRYAEFAAAAPRLPIPATEDPGYHLGTLFAPVRPRGGYLEVRYLDAQPPDRMATAITTVATLLYHPRARRDALDLLLPRIGDQDRAWAEAAAGYSPETEPLLSIVASARDAVQRSTSGSVAEVGMA
jgi:glutamate--cysteine ligase